MVRGQLTISTLSLALGALAAGFVLPSPACAGGHHRQKGFLVAVPVGAVQPAPAPSAAAYTIAQPAASYSYAMPIVQPTYGYPINPAPSSYTVAAPSPAATYQITVVPAPAAAAPPVQPAAAFSPKPPTVNITVIEASKPAAAPAASPPSAQGSQADVPPPPNSPTPAAAPPVAYAVPVQTAQPVQLFFVPYHRCSIFCKH